MYLKLESMFWDLREYSSSSTKIWRTLWVMWRSWRISWTYPSPKRNMSEVCLKKLWHSIISKVWEILRWIIVKITRNLARIGNSLFLWKGETGYSKNYLTNDLAEFIDHITLEKFKTSGLPFTYLIK